MQGDNTSDLDFGAVQRGDPEMEQKMNRVIRACVEAARGNPICSLHDQGAGGNGEEGNQGMGPGLPGLLSGLAEVEGSGICNRLPSPGSHSPPPHTSWRGLDWVLGACCCRMVGDERAAAMHTRHTELGAPLFAGCCPQPGHHLSFTPSHQATS